MATIKTYKVSAKSLGGFLIETKAGNHTVLVDQPVEGGGKDQGPTPLDFVLIALAGCMITIGKIVAHQQKLSIRDIQVNIEGDLNLDVLRGQETNERSGFQEVRVDMVLDSDLTQEEKEQFVAEVDRSCPVSDNLINPTSVQITVH
jgi:uncharacterized OsmC-like protein